jgi:hypothetical protein
MANREATNLCSIVVVGCEDAFKFAGMSSSKLLKTSIERYSMHARLESTWSYLELTCDRDGKSPSPMQRLS